MMISEQSRVPCYANGKPYRALHTPHSEKFRPRHCLANALPSLLYPDLTWARLWDLVSSELDHQNYSAATKALYRSILRNVYRHAHGLPAGVNAGTIRTYIDGLVGDHASWSWLAMNISVLRTVFDKLGARNLTGALVTPKRPFRLPEILSPDEVRQVLAAATTTRDQLLLGLLYGCGLKVGELCQLRWRDVDLAQSALRVTYARGKRERWLALPPDLLPVLGVGFSHCPSDDYIFQGRVAGTHLSTRMVELIVRKAAKATDTLKTVTCMTLRHSSAVHSLEAGDSVRAVQEALGHASIDTTLLYEECILPDIPSPLAAIRALQSPSPPHPIPTSTFEMPCRATAETGSSVRDSPSHSSPTSTFKIPYSSVRHSLSPSRDLFKTPPSIEHLDLPFSSSAAQPMTQLFQRLLSTHVFGRFLCKRRSTTRAG